MEIHGPGYSKVILGEDCVDEWEKYLDVMVASIVENGGRSCVNASAVWTPAHAEEISEALAERLARIFPRAADDEAAQLAPFADPNVASRISQIIDQGLAEPGARDVTAAHRKEERLVSWNACSYLLPTIVYCEDPEHPLSNKEFLFPFASVVNVPQNQLRKHRTQPGGHGDYSRPGTSSATVSSPMSIANVGPDYQPCDWDQPHGAISSKHLYARGLSSALPLSENLPWKPILKGGQSDVLRKLSADKPCSGAAFPWSYVTLLPCYRPHARTNKCESGGSSRGIMCILNILSYVSYSLVARFACGIPNQC